MKKLTKRQIAEIKRAGAKLIGRRCCEIQVGERLLSDGTRTFDASHPLNHDLWANCTDLQDVPINGPMAIECWVYSLMPFSGEVEELKDHQYVWLDENNKIIKITDKHPSEWRP